MVDSHISFAPCGANLRDLQSHAQDLKLILLNYRKVLAMGTFWAALKHPLDLPKTPRQTYR
jgi:hypothetical protein